MPAANDSAASPPAGMLALVTEAFGGRGGIAQYNRDFLEAAVGCHGALDVDIIPRLTPRDAVARLPSNIRQHAVPRGKIRYSLTVIRAARKIRPAIVFCGHLYMAPLALLAARLAGAKLVIQVHGIEIWSTPSYLQRLALEVADLTLCVSRDTRRRVLAAAAVAFHKARVLPNTVAPQFIPGDKSKARARFGWSCEDVILLSVGRLSSLERYKGHDRVIQALPRLRRACPHVRYMIAGEGADRSRLEALAGQYQVSDAVSFVGHVALQYLPTLYQAADLFVLPSTGEGFGIVYLEAMACGTPAVGLGVAGARDALVEGQLGKAPTPGDLEDTLVRSFESPALAGETLAAAVEKHFGRPVFVAHVSDIMRALGSDVAPATRAGR